MNINNKHSYTWFFTHTHNRNPVKHPIPIVVVEEVAVLVVVHIQQVVRDLGSAISLSLTTGGGLPGESLPIL